MVLDLCEYVRKYRSENRGKGRTILRSHLPLRWVRIPNVCTHLLVVSTAVYD